MTKSGSQGHDLVCFVQGKSSYTEARRELGLQNMKSKGTEIEECIKHCMSIHREVDQSEIVSMRLKLTLNMYDSDSCSELDSDM